jgi:apolipoprotein N-acyltransferase
MSFLPGKRMSAVETSPKRSRTGPRSVAAPEEAVVNEVGSSGRVWALSFAGSLLLWAAFPPLGWSFLAWIAPIPWLMLVRDEKFAGRRPYGVLWFAGLLHWLAVLQGIRLAHWATYFGLAALCLYLAVYLPLFVTLTRVAVHRLKTPLLIAAPVVWVGLEFARGHVLTGFSLALLGHTQVGWVPLIQISDLFGAYGVSFLVMLIAACLANCLPNSSRTSTADGRPWRVWPLIPAAALLAAALGYGKYRTSQVSDDASRPVLKAAMVQGWVETIFEYDPERDVENFNHYAELSRKAAAEHPDLDVIIWPESAFSDTRPLITRDDPPPGQAWSSDFDAWFQEAAGRFEQKSKRHARELGGNTSLLVGLGVHHMRRDGTDQYNSAVHISPAGEVVDRYDKMHPVMFGEYVPLGDWFPWLYRLTPLGGGLSRGRQAETFEIAGMRLAPDVCFESTAPHLIRRHVMELKQRGEAPDVLVNLTNDGWFRGSSIIDLHLACSVFRAVEHRKPMLAAANTGLSAWIDGNGRIRAQGPRFDDAILVAEVRPDVRRSLYTRWGDWAAVACLAFCLVAAISPAVGRLRK